MSRAADLEPFLRRYPPPEARAHRPMTYLVERLAGLDLDRVVDALKRLAPLRQFLDIVRRMQTDA